MFKLNDIVIHGWYFSNESRYEYPLDWEYQLYKSFHKIIYRENNIIKIKPLTELKFRLDIELAKYDYTGKCINMKEMYTEIYKKQPDIDMTYTHCIRLATKAEIIRFYLT